ncbi:MAG TPA: serine/threonine-protein kinase [Ktedonobacteraceae bacterium]|nr:serine/threonine-protein kinase [Ktedonobacteraceae bacterium]
MQNEQTILSQGAVLRGVHGASYVVESLLGKGGFGAVYVVRDRRVKSGRFALKELIGQDKLDRDCFLFEGELLRRLDHPALPHVYGVFENKKLSRVYMLMDYIQGRNLNDLRKEQPDRRFTLSVALALLAPIVDALTYLHEQDPPVVHRDIKPGNIIVPFEGKGAMLVDFGTAKEYDNEATTCIVRQVTTGYAAPEQYMGGTNPRTDIYGLGATLYTLLSGQTPPDALVRATRSKGCDPFQAENQGIPGVSLSIVKILQRAMSLSSDDRFETVEEFWQELQAHAPRHEGDDEQISAIHALHTDLTSQAFSKEHSGKRPAAFVQSWRKPLVLVLAALALLLTASTGTGFLFHGGSSPTIAQQHALQSRPTTKTTGTTRTTATLNEKTGASNYPLLATSYAGTVADIMTKENTSLFLTNIQQNRQQIQGSFRGLGLTGAFNGTITPDGQVSFTVKIYRGTMLLQFEGTIKIGGDMAGSFAVTSQQGQHTGEIGLWDVASSSD